MTNPNEKFGEIYDQYIEKIYRFVYLKVNSQETAEDITSRVFLNGWESYQKDPGRIQSAGPFLYQIARNMVIDHYRDKGRTKVVSVEQVSQVFDDKNNIHEKAIVNSDIQMVKNALLHLKKDYQDVIIWHYLEDMPVEEISQILGKPAGTVRVMIHRGLNALKNDLIQES